MTYPKRLSKDPIVDAVCDIRFTSSYPGSASAVPVLIASQLGIAGSLNDLPVMQIPEALRKAS